jgi:hypothetical protein
MAPVPNGVYAIARPQDQLLTLMGGSKESGEPVVLLPPTGNPGEQEWEVQGVGDATVTIRNLKNRMYVGFDGDPKPNSQVSGCSEPQEWTLLQILDSQVFHIVAPGGPVDGEELALDLSLLRIFPPRLALRPLEASNPRQAWTFEFHE